MRTAFIEALGDLAEQDERIFLLTGDLGFSVLEPFARRHPDRHINAGIAEQNMIGVATGLALSGYTVFAYSIANFPTLRALEQIRNDVCHHQANVKIVAVGGGCAYGAQGATHHGVEDLGVLRVLPGLTLVAPGDPIESRLATRAIAETPGPCYLRLGKTDEPVVHETEPDFQLGRALEVRPGNDLTLISTGGVLGDALTAAERVARRGISARVLSMHTVKPLDRAAVLKAAEETGAIVSVEEHSIFGGLGTAVAEILAEAELTRVRFHRHALPDQVTQVVGDRDFYWRQAGDLTADVLGLLNGRRIELAAQFG